MKKAKSRCGAGPTGGAPLARIAGDAIGPERGRLVEQAAPRAPRRRHRPEAGHPLAAIDVLEVGERRSPGAASAESACASMPMGLSALSAARS